MPLNDDVKFKKIEKKTSAIFTSLEYADKRLPKITIKYYAL